MFELEEMAFFCLLGRAAQAVLSNLRLRRESAGSCPSAMVFLTGGEGELAGVLCCSGVRRARMLARQLWYFCEELAAYGLDLATCSEAELAALPGWDGAKARLFVGKRR